MDYRDKIRMGNIYLEPQDLYDAVLDAEERMMQYIEGRAYRLLSELLEKDMIENGLMVMEDDDED